MRTRTAVPVAAVCGAAAVFGAGALASDGGSRAGAAAQDPSENRALLAVLTGRKEVDDEGRRGAGDLNGRGSFSATVDGSQLCFGITVKNLDAPGAAHIHRGRRLENGPIVVTLEHPDSGDPGASSGCVTVDEEIAQAILRRPGRYYVNVHTAAFGAGAVRGNLFRRAR
jgi:CHRD domain